MKKCLVLATLVASGLALGLAPSAHAQGNAVVIVDLAYIFQNHRGFKQATEQMKADVTAAEQSLKAERDAIAEALKTLREGEELQPGTQEYKDMEAELTQRDARLQADIALKKKEFMEREAKIYYQVYKQVSGHIDAYARSNGVALVLRFNGEPADESNPQTVLKELNKSVVWSHPDIDITPIILEKCNKDRAPGTASRPRNSGAGAARE
jgi:outer membrane protein